MTSTARTFVTLLLILLAPAVADQLSPHNPSRRNLTPTLTAFLVVTNPLEAK